MHGNPIHIMAKPGSRSGSHRGDRHLWKSFRLSEPEFLEIEAKASAAGVTVSELIRSELLDIQPGPTDRTVTAERDTDDDR